MNKVLISLLLVICCQSISQAQNQAIMDTFSYSVGILLAQNLKQQGLDDVNTKALSLGIADALASKPEITFKQAMDIVEKHMNNKAAEKYAEIMEEGQAYMKQNAQKPEVKVLESGIQYEVLQEGSGAIPKLSDKVTTHYTGMLVNGNVFDSSVSRGKPATFPVNGGIKGWQEVLQLMPVGSKWKIVIPQELAYGERGAGKDIPPFSTLIFEIELLSIN
jgi:FKBP-type peptidyl-prolyl cis-trans isomerase FklB